MGVDGGARAAVRAAQILCEEQEIEPDLVPELVRDFLQARWEDRRGVLTLPSAQAVERAAQHALFEVAQAHQPWVRGNDGGHR